MYTSNLRSTRLAASLTAALALAGLGANAFAATIAVTSCADDGSAGTLRQAAAAIASGDTLDLTGLSCAGSTITLTQGEIVLAHNANLTGSASERLTITSTASRVLNSTSTDAPGGYLGLTNLNITGGRIYTDADNAYGGCISSSGTLTLISTKVSDCAVSSASGMAVGGAISAQTVNLVLSRVSGSTANAMAVGQTSRGGGIYATSLACTDSSLSGNFALAATSQGAYGQGGGALILGGDASFLRCTVDSNSASIGGGIMQLMFRDIASSSTFKDSTISGNLATFGFGGVYAFCPDCTPAHVQLMNSTVAFNSSSTYGGAIGTQGNVTAYSSIISGNTVSGASEGADVYAKEIAGSDNLILSTNAIAAPGAITITADPSLLPLADNGGPTQTLALASTSPALDRGNNMAELETDQRGLSRIAGGEVDIGAYQQQDADEIFHATF